MLASLVALLAAAPPAAAQFSEIETDDLELIYPGPVQEYLVPHLGRCFENALDRHRILFRYQPSEKITIFVTDFTDFGNGNATAVPRDRINVDIAPFSFAYETMPPNERMITMMNHELVHVITMDQAAPRDRFFRRMFLGKPLPDWDHPESIGYFYLATPRGAVPRWYQEGGAVFVETWMAGGIGRAQGSYDEMVFRSMVADGRHFHDPLALVSEGVRTDFQAGVNAYLYGTRFITWLAYVHSPEKVLEWLGRGEDSEAYYAKQFEKVFGRKLNDAWAEWIEWEHDFQERNLAAVRQYPITPHTDLSVRALGSVSRSFVDPQARKLYTAFNFPGMVAHVGAISLDTGAVEPLLEVKGPTLFTVTSLAFDPGARTLFYTTDNFAYRDLRALDLATGKDRTLLKDARIGDLAFVAADRSLLGIRHFNGITTLVRIPPPYDQWEQIHSWPYGEVAYDLDVSPDGSLVSLSLGHLDGHHTLQVLPLASLQEGKPAPLAEVDFGTTIPSNFVFTRDGAALYGSSYYTGVSNIFRYDLATKKLDAVSNAETGFFRPIPQEDGSLVVFRYSGDGFVPARIDPRPLEDVSAITFLGQQVIEKHPSLKEWLVGPPDQVDLEARKRSQGPYRQFRSLRLESLFPVVEGYRDYGAIGVRAHFSDPIFLNRLSVTASFTPNNNLEQNERFHLDVQYDLPGWTIQGKLNDADFYDLFGPTQVSRKGYSLGATYKRYLIYDEPRTLQLSAGGTAYANLDTLPAYQNINSPSEELFTAGVSLDYSNQRASIGAVEQEKGWGGSISLDGSYIPEGGTIPSLLATYDVGFPVPLRNSSFWIRTAAGAARGEVDDPFANFFFGGFGNNWVDHRNVKRYREYYSFPGLELNQAAGRNFAKAMLEWNLPPLHFGRGGWPGFHIAWMRTSLFTTGLITNLDDPDLQERAGDVGAQVDFRIQALSALKLTLSLGYAVAVHDLPDAAAVEDGSRDEFMFSLSILH